ncbi:inter-alpha-trypsin inhibitor heavy chain H4-like isoform X1 [Diabrotica undecimpunctata]|uniref:inter-alpha-trypsin inhibitor heavy chain H4-like isoform X1 n=1 Tax=Diabrotica undecimpunctata TaxID=50387 RepID=UPI003B634309
MKYKILCFCLLVLYNIKLGKCATGDVSFIIFSDNENKGHLIEKRDVEQKPPIIYEMNVNSNVSNRFATTVIESKVKNAYAIPREAVFSVILPEQAFISEFVMIIGGKSYKAYVKGKEEAKNIYDKAVSSGQSAAHVAVSARDSHRFTVSVNVEPEAKATFLLTYEELLERRNNQYELVLNINPGQIVKDLNVKVNISESRPLVFVKTPALRSGNEVSKNEDKLSPSANIEKISPTNSIVTFQPDVQKQKEYGKELAGKESDGLTGQFIVQYEVERDPSGGEILLKDGYFIHFFAPKDIESLPKNVYFILDTSGSMAGIKIQQLRNAMNSILDEIKPEDTLNIVEFNSETFVWNIEAETSVKVKFSNYTHPYEQLKENDMPGPLPASQPNIAKAKKLVSNMIATGGTYMIGGLETGLYLIKSEMERSVGTDNKRQPIVIFLTDGQPNIGLYSTAEITKQVTHLNSDGINVPIFSLSFGQGADKAFLRKLSLENSGFSRHIYDASDAALQLHDFYKIISSPLMTNINFKYDTEAKELTKIHYPIYFRGNEIAIAGKYTGNKLTAEVNALGRRGPIRLLPKIEEPVTSLERLWAYLTIKQTLEKREVAENKDELTKKALELALKYSFVTEVTSLVVVKPNATNAVNTEEASQSNRGGSVIAYNKLARRPAIGHSYKLASASFAPLSHRTSVKYATRPSHWYVSDHSRAPTSTIPYVKPKIEDKLPWLATAMNSNRTITLPDGVFELGDSNLVNYAHSACPKTPQGVEGECVLIKDCPTVLPYLTDLAAYTKYFCPVETKYAGVCCPKVLKLPARGL